MIIDETQVDIPHILPEQQGHIIYCFWIWAKYWQNNDTVAKNILIVYCAITFSYNYRS